MRQRFIFTVVCVKMSYIDSMRPHDRSELQLEVYNNPLTHANQSYAAHESTFEDDSDLLTESNRKPLLVIHTSDEPLSTAACPGVLDVGMRSHVLEAKCILNRVKGLVTEWIPARSGTEMYVECSTESDQRWGYREAEEYWDSKKSHNLFPTDSPLNRVGSAVELMLSSEKDIGYVWGEFSEYLNDHADLLWLKYPNGSEEYWTIWSSFNGRKFLNYAKENSNPSILLTPPS